MVACRQSMKIQIQRLVLNICFDKLIVNITEAVDIDDKALRKL